MVLVVLIWGGGVVVVFARETRKMVHLSTTRFLCSGRRLQGKKKKVDVLPSSARASLSSYMLRIPSGFVGFACMTRVFHLQRAMQSTGEKSNWKQRGARDPAGDDARGRGADRAWLRVADRCDTVNQNYVLSLPRKTGKNAAVHACCLCDIIKGVRLNRRAFPEESAQTKRGSLPPGWVDLAGSLDFGLRLAMIAVGFLRAKQAFQFRS